MGRLMIAAILCAMLSQVMKSVSRLVTVNLKYIPKYYNLIIHCIYFSFSDFMLWGF